MFKAQPSGPSGLREGVLIDFDHAIQVDKHKKTAIGKRSGKFPFVAINILRAWYEAKLNTKRPKEWTEVFHSFTHDLESVFSVFCCVCIIIGAGPNFTPRPRSDKYKFNKQAIHRCFTVSGPDPDYEGLAG